jgi:hypothetical protein
MKSQFLVHKLLVKFMEDVGLLVTSIVARLSWWIALFFGITIMENWSIFSMMLFWTFLNAWIGKR